MSREDITLDFSGHSLHLQNAYLKNCTQIPSHSGNSAIQIASYPGISTNGKQLNVDTDQIVHTYECWQYVIVYRLSADGYLHCDAFDHLGNLVQENIIPSEPWDNSRPLANEFVGEYGFKTSEWVPSTTGSRRNLNFSQVQNLSPENADGFPRGHWVENDDYSVMPVYVCDNNVDRVDVIRSIAQQCYCTCVSSDPEIGTQIIPTFSYTFDVNWKSSKSRLTDAEDSGYWIILKRNKEMFVIDAGDRYTLGQNLNRVWNAQNMVINSVSYSIEILNSGAASLFTDPAIQYTVGIDDFGNFVIVMPDGSHQNFRTNDPNFPNLPLLAQYRFGTLEDYINSNPGMDIRVAKKVYTKMVSKWNAANAPETATVTNVPQTGYSKLFIPNNEDVLWFDVIASRLIVVSDENVFWYSDAQTLRIDGLSYYETEFLNSKPYSVWTLGNRLVIIADRMTQIWDLSGDENDPLSAAFQCNTYQYQIIPETVVRKQEKLFFMANAIETPNVQICSLSKTGEWARLSQPQMETWVNKQFPWELLSNGNTVGEAVDGSLITASVSQFNNMDFILWKLAGDTVLAYNEAMKTFFECSELTFYSGLTYWKWKSNLIGNLDDYKQDSEYITPNFNFGGKLATIRTINIDHDIRGDLAELIVTIDRVCGQSIRSLRKLAITPFTGIRNIRSKINGVGAGTDVRTSIRWRGHNNINVIRYEID